MCSVTCDNIYILLCIYSVLRSGKGEQQVRFEQMFYMGVNYLHESEQIYGDDNPLAFVDVLSLLCSSKGSSTTKTMSVNITEIGIHDGLHHPP